MNLKVKITTFRNPFSFFCIPENAIARDNIKLSEDNGIGALNSNKFDLSGVNHGQTKSNTLQGKTKYVAVLWNNNWVRGVITLESKFLIWLVDYGIYIRPNEKTVYVDLPAEDKKYPTKVFEASIHGVTPVEKVSNDMCEIISEVSKTWSCGAIMKAEKLIAEAVEVQFVPIAVLSTKTNDIVIGNLFLKFKDRRIVNLVDELEKSPVFLQKDPEIYVKQLSQFYTFRRQHRASLKKPELPHLVPTMTLKTSLDDYTAICANAPELDAAEEIDSDEEGSTVTFVERVEPQNSAFKLTPAEIEKYSNIYITVAGREYNLLNVLLNKARDLKMCEMYKDLKSIGRACSRSSRSSNTRNNV